MAPTFSRRSVLTTVVGACVGLAGCGSEPAGDGTAGPGFDNVVSDVTVTKREVVVELASTEVTEAVLISPDGTAFDSQTVETGVRTVRFPIIELDISQGNGSHYDPGTYEIVLVSDGEEFSQELSLVPDLRITAVEQYRDGEDSVDLSRIAFSIENVGTGPTWVYDFGFEGSPNFTANDDLSDNPGISYLMEPATEDELLLAPSEEQRYIDSSRPLSLTESEYTCQSSTPMFTSRLGIADGTVLSVEIQPSLGGDSLSLGFADQFVCTQVEIAWTVTGESSE